MNQVVAQNSFSSLIIHGLVKRNDGAAASLHLPSVKPPTPQTEFVYTPFRTRNEYRPPPSCLPPPGNLTLEIKIGEQLGYGRVGRVYSTDVLSPTNANLPPLVAKVSIPGYSHSVAREAGFYEEMESLQGISIARCYGLFQTQLDGDFTLLTDGGETMKTGLDQKRLMDRAPGDVPLTHTELAPLHWIIFRMPYSACRRLRDIDETVDKDQDQVDEPEYKGLDLVTVSQKKEHAKYVSFLPREPLYEDDESMAMSKTPPGENLYTEADPTVISIIILERLGGYIPMKTKLDAIRLDVIDVYHDMARLGVRQQDIRWCNILRVPRDSLKTRLPCPTHGRVHEWYVVDFDLALKTQLRLSDIDADTWEFCSEMLNGLMFGKIIEPFEVE